MSTITLAVYDYQATWWVSAEQAAMSPGVEAVMRRLHNSVRAFSLSHAEAAPFLRWAERLSGWTDQHGHHPFQITVGNLGSERWQEQWRDDTCYSAGWQVRDQDGDLWACRVPVSVRRPGDGMNEWRKLSPNGRAFATGPYALQG